MRQFFGQLTMMLSSHLQIVHSYAILDDNARKRNVHNPIRIYTYTHNVRIMNQWITGHQGERAMIDAMAPILRESDAIIMNVGAFHHQEQQLSDVLHTFIKEMRDIHMYKGQMMWREYSPSHFHTIDGEFIADRSLPSFNDQYPCTNENRAMNGYESNWRLHVGNRVMEEYGIPILRVFNISSERFDMHPHVSNDCRHWFHPSSTLESWVTLLHNWIVKE